MMELVPRPSRGRVYANHRPVRISDAGVDGSLRLDGAARYLQDVATDDWAEAGLDPGAVWVVRRATIRQASGARWPRLGEHLSLLTWCAGTGPAWAERRTDFEVDGQVLARAVALWVLVDGAGRPLRLPDEFARVYGEACGGRKVSGRVPTALSADELGTLGAATRPWAVRRADLDILDHVNNAAVWAAVTEVAGNDVAGADVTHHGPLDAAEPVVLATLPGRMFLLGGPNVLVSAELAR